MSNSNDGRRSRTISATEKIAKALKLLERIRIRRAEDVAPYDEALRLLRSLI